MRKIHSFNKFRSNKMDRKADIIPVSGRDTSQFHCSAPMVALERMRERNAEITCAGRSRGGHVELATFFHRRGRRVRQSHA